MHPLKNPKLIYELERLAHLTGGRDVIITIRRAPPTMGPGVVDIILRLNSDGRGEVNTHKADLHEMQYRMWSMIDG